MRIVMLNVIIVDKVRYSKSSFAKWTVHLKTKAYRLEYKSQ